MAHHVCLTGDLQCSGVNPCRACKDVHDREVLFQAMNKTRQHYAQTRGVEYNPQAGRGLITVQELVDPSQFFAVLYGFYEEALRDLHANMMRDPEIHRRAFDLSRIPPEVFTQARMQAASFPQAFPPSPALPPSSPSAYGQPMMAPYATNGAAPTYGSTQPPFPPMPAQPPFPPMSAQPPFPPMSAQPPFPPVSAQPPFTSMPTQPQPLVPFGQPPFVAPTVMEAPLATSAPVYGASPTESGEERGASLGSVSLGSATLGSIFANPLPAAPAAVEPPTSAAAVVVSAERVPFGPSPNGPTREITADDIARAASIVEETEEAEPADAVLNGVPAAPPSSPSTAAISTVD